MKRGDLPAPRTPRHDRLRVAAEPAEPRRDLGRPPQVVGFARRVRVWDDPPKVPMTIPQAAAWLGEDQKYVTTLVNQGLIGCWPAEVGIRLGLLDARWWPAGQVWVIDRAELSNRPTLGDRARAAAAPAGADPAMRYFLAIGPVVVHPADECPGRCAVHQPSAHRLSGARLMWQRQPFVAVLRACPHGVRHPDPDGIAGQVDAGGSHVGACCGCCR